MKELVFATALAASGCGMSTSISNAAPASVPAPAPSTVPATATAASPQVLGALSTAILDSLAFGDAASEQAHSLAAPAGQSDVVAGALGQSARRLLPPPTAGWQGGRVSFTMKVDPARPNFFTARFWGGEGNEGRLILFAEGRQVGWNHLGDTDQLDFGSERGAPATPGRFFTKTLPLPLALTQGKAQLHLEIRAIGRIWAYGTSFEQYQHPMEAPSRGLYRVYTHADGFFVPPANEQPGAAGTTKTPLRAAPGPEVLAALRQRVSGEVSRQMARDRPLNQMEMLFLARAYAIKWTPAYQNAAALDKIVAGLDAIFAAYRANPKLAQEDPATPNPDWFGLGPSGNVISLLAEQIKPRLDGQISDGAGAMLTRRVAFAEMLIATRDWHRENRRQYTNQSMINDLYGIYLANRGLQVVDSSQALPEARALRYLYESVGLEPWLGSEKDGVPAKPLGDKYLQLTDKGLTKELGYVGYYGEVLDWVATLYEGTRSAPGAPGDARILAQLLKIARARLPFRYPALDDEGNRTMRVESIVGWRDEHFPGDVVYAQRPSWDGSSLQAAAITLEPQLVGAAQQMLDDNQFFSSLRDQMKETGFRSTAGLLDTPEQYETLRAQPRSTRGLPMAAGQPDFVFSDEEDGVVAIKNGGEILYASLYWRACTTSRPRASASPPCVRRAGSRPAG